MNIGLFISEAEGVISKSIDLQWIINQYSHLPSVKIFTNILSDSSIKAIKEEIISKDLQGVVLAGESPLFYNRIKNGDFIIRTIKEAGVNFNHIGFANIKEQVALPHRSTPMEATRKAKVLIDVAVEKVRLSKAVKEIEVTPKKSVAIFGTTVGGIFAAAELLRRGYRIHFIDHTEDIRDLRDMKAKVMPTLGYIKSHEMVSFHFSDVNDLYGYAGNFRISLENGDSIRAGGIIVAVDDDILYTTKLYPFLRIERDSSGYFKHIDSDTSTVETVIEGIALIPKLNSPPLSSIIMMADAASVYIDSILSQKEIHHELFVSEVDENVCGGCGTCIKTCIFHAAELDPVKKLSSTNIHRCVGCGNCVAACPTGARDQIAAPTGFLLSAVRILSSYNPPEGIKVLYILCDGCGYPSLDEAGKIGIEYPTSVLPLRVRCGGRVDTQIILDAFREGFDGVVICKCMDDHCMNIIGNLDLDRRVNLFRSVLRSRGIEPERLRVLSLPKCDGVSCVGNAVEFIDHLKKIGGNP
jgi:heterodisulfide reductase subunit A-like polyferredoxin/coenzyme F420-reducing hydrogenase delta subunit